jgi:hypothetical protein
MNSPELRDRGLHRVRRLTIGIGGAAVVVTGVFAGWFGRPQPSSASTTTVTDPVAPSAGPSTTSPPATAPSTSAPATSGPSTVPGQSQSQSPSTSPSNPTPTSPPTTVRPRSTAPVTPPSVPPRPGRRRPSSGSGGS